MSEELVGPVLNVHAVEGGAYKSRNDPGCLDAMKEDLVSILGYE